MALRRASAERSGRLEGIEEVLEIRWLVAIIVIGELEEVTAGLISWAKAVSQAEQAPVPQLPAEFMKTCMPSSPAISPKDLSDKAELALAWKLCYLLFYRYNEMTLTVSSNYLCLGLNLGFHFVWSSLCTSAVKIALALFKIVWRLILYLLDKYARAKWLCIHVLKMAASRILRLFDASRVHILGNERGSPAVQYRTEIPEAV